MTNEQIGSICDSSRIICFSAIRTQAELIKFISSFGWPLLRTIGISLIVRILACLVLTLTMGSIQLLNDNVHQITSGFLVRHSKYARTRTHIQIASLQIWMITPKIWR